MKIQHLINALVEPQIQNEAFGDDALTLMRNKEKEKAMAQMDADAAARDKAPITDPAADKLRQTYAAQDAAKQPVAPASSTTAPTNGAPSAVQAKQDSDGDGTPDATDTTDAPAGSKAMANKAGQLTGQPAAGATNTGAGTPSSTGGTTTPTSTGLTHTASATNPNQPTPAATPGQAPAGQKGDWWNKFKDIAGAAKDATVGTIKGVGDIASQVAGGVTQTVGAAAGGLGAGYHTARQKRSFGSNNRGYEPNFSGPDTYQGSNYQGSTYQGDPYQGTVGSTQAYQSGFQQGVKAARLNPNLRESVKVIDVKVDEVSDLKKTLKLMNTRV